MCYTYRISYNTDRLMTLYAININDFMHFVYVDVMYKEKGERKCIKTHYLICNKKSQLSVPFLYSNLICF